jgi:L-alanine-DL-glutamate epimerase-like enolase superfamily enzyme
MQVRFQPISLPFQYPFTISKGTKTHQPSLVVQLEHRGVIGWGEAPAITYYNITVDQMIHDLEQKKSFVERFAFTDPERYWHYLHHVFPSNPFLVSALDMAAWDIYGKMCGKPLYRLWKGDAVQFPLTDYTIGIDATDRMVQKMKAHPWPIYKVKVGTPDDVSILEALRAETGARLRVDANAGWTLSQALELLPVLETLGVELIEQPLAKDAWSEMEQLRAVSSIPLYADESCVFESDVEKCASFFHGINIKLTKCSGITPERRMIQKARTLGLKVMVGSMNESSLGSAAIAHLLPFIDEVDMDGPLLLSEDIATGLRYEQGRVLIPEGPGLGVRCTLSFE